MQSTISTTLAAGLHLEQTLFTPSFGSTETTSIILTHPLTKYLHYDIPYQNNSLKRKRNYEEEEEERIYNPLKLPLGWDGKPIPYWLYKLHGLGVEYRCEICSDHVYMGR